MNIRRVQREAWANKILKGFNTTDVPLEFMLLTEEIGEAFSAWRKQHDGFGGELADILIFLVSVAEMTGVDLQAETEAKLAKNAGRHYRQLPNGTFVKAGT